MNKEYKGSCLCGAVLYSVKGFSDEAANCHCSMCRKFHGAASASLVGVTGLKWLSGQRRLKKYEAFNGIVRIFCQDCGSSLGFQAKGAPPTDIELAIATFDDDIPVVIDAHIYTNYKANWDILQDNLPTFAEGREC